jgi:hypothetical protein
MLDEGDQLGIPRKEVLVGGEDLSASSPIYRVSTSWIAESSSVSYASVVHPPPKPAKTAKNPRSDLSLIHMNSNDRIETEKRKDNK